MDWIWAIDLSDRHTYSNHMVTKILGYTPEEFVGKDYLSFLLKEDREKLTYVFPRYITEKRGWKGLVLRWRHKDGTCRYLESNAKPIINSSGEVVGFSGVDRDITENKLAENKQKESEDFSRDSDPADK
jgi:PAS domain S-box-containing protein